MTLPKATRAQLFPLIERAIGAADRGQPVFVVVHADPDDVPHVGDVAGRAVTIHGSRSPLQIRTLVQRGRGGTLVVLTDCEPSSLGEDLLARAFRNRVLHLDRWATVCQLFGVDRPSAELAHRPHLADALIESAPLAGYPKPASRVLDLETATAALLQASIGITEDIADLAGLLRWAGRPAAAGRIASARGELLRDLEPALRTRFGPGVDAVLVALAADRSNDLIPLGLVASAVYAPPADDVVAITRFDERLGAANLDAVSYRAWGSAAERLVQNAEDPAKAAGWLERADALLRDLNAGALAERSDYLPSGFDQRMRRAAESLSRWHNAPADAELADDAHRAVARVASHAGNRHSPERVERLRMVERMVRRGSCSLRGLEEFVTAASEYERDGAWLDAARTVVSRGDSDPTLASLCAELTNEADQARVADGLRFARMAAAAASSVPAPHTGVENVLDRVVVPLARLRPVLLLVLDGLGWPTFTELVGTFEGAGWSPWRQTAPDAPSSVAVAALPTVTEVSRTSLLAGRLRTGDAASEGRAFAGHAGMLTVTGAGPKPELFHKSDLRVGGLDALPHGVLDAITDDRRKIVALVINNIDERLKDVAQPADGWQFRDLDPLRLVLEEARRVGRAVVITADHGHVLDRDAEARPGVGGERWRQPEPPAGEGELLVSGPRVVIDSYRVVLPWREQIRYGPRRNGYHGGLTPKELFVPLVVLSVDDLPADSGWQPAGFRRPAWWHHTQLRVATVVPDIQVPPLVPVKPVVPTLFDPEPEPVAPPAVDAARVPAWIEALLVSPLMIERRNDPRRRLDDAQLRRLLSVFDAAGSMAVNMSRLANEADLPPARIGRYVAQLEDLLNVDGYGVVSADGDEVRLNRPLLDRQFSL
jgi:hypothetical protein